ncbi:MAG: hypothetical protein ACKOKC_08590 [Chthoniobacterales bacterium]
MSTGEQEGKHWQAARVTVWLAIFGATLGFWAGAGTLLLRWFR